jgi:hypothetical protein
MLAAANCMLLHLLLLLLLGIKLPTAGSSLQAICQRLQSTPAAAVAATAATSSIVTMYVSKWWALESQQPTC